MRRATRGRAPHSVDDLLDRDALCEVTRLVDVTSAADRDVVGQQLQRHRHHDRRQ